MRRAVVVLVALAGLGTASMADARATVETTAEFDSLSYENNSRIFDVDVSSEKSRCERQRVVKVFEKVNGGDNLMGRDNTGDSSSATITKRPAMKFKEGEKFYAVVKKREVGDTICKGTQSATITITSA